MEQAIARLRRFNRFYTRQLGLLDECLTRSPFTLGEARVLYELATRCAPTAASIARDLGIDPAQLSRTLARLKERRLVESAPSPDHAKHLILTLTPAGRSAFAALDAAADAQIDALLSPLDPTDGRRLIAAAEEIEAVLSRASAPADGTFRLRDPESGDLGWIAHRQGILYAREYGWDWRYEALVAEILAGFARDYDPEREQGWIAEHRGAVAGSVFLMRGDEAATAKLRLLYVEPAARGLGIGTALVGTCIARARAAGYRRLTLWTNDVLTAARRIYEAAGFRLEAEAPHDSFGHRLNGQTWVLALR